MKKKHIKSAMPLYIAAAIWLLAGLIAPKLVLKLWGLILVGAISAAAAIVSRKFFPGRDIEIEEKIETGDVEIDKAIEEGRERLKHLNQANEQIPDEVITRNLTRMTEAGEQIFRELGRNKDKYTLVRRFMNYYLPTAEKLMEQYQILVSTGSEGENVRQAMTSIENSTGMIGDAFEKCLDNLFADREMDIDTDIKVLQTMLAGDGLLKGQPSDIHATETKTQKKNEGQVLTLGR